MSWRCRLSAGRKIRGRELSTGSRNRKRRTLAKIAKLAKDRSVKSPEFEISDSDPLRAWRSLRENFRVHAGTSRIRVISDGAPKRFGGPQYPVPRLVYTHRFFNRFRPAVNGCWKRTK